MACILLWSSAVRVHDSQAYRKMDVTRERISRILELREILLSIQTGFSLVNAAVALCYPGEYLRLGTLISYNWAQVFEACDCLKLLSYSLWSLCWCHVVLTWHAGRNEYLGTWFVFSREAWLRLPKQNVEDMLNGRKFCTDLSCLMTVCKAMYPFKSIFLGNSLFPDNSPKLKHLKARVDPVTKMLSVSHDPSTSVSCWVTLSGQHDNQFRTPFSPNLKLH